IFRFNKTKIRNKDQQLHWGGAYYCVSLALSCLIGGSLFNYYNSQADQNLYHLGQNIGVAIAQNSNTKSVSHAEFLDKLQKGFINPLSENLRSEYQTSDFPEIKTLPAKLPQSLQASLFSDQGLEYTLWAKERGYNLIIYGDIEKGESEQMNLDLSFAVLSDANTISQQNGEFDLKYTINNYNDEMLLASMDNLVQEIAGIILYLDGKYLSAIEKLQQAIASLEREKSDYQAPKTEIERKAFELYIQKIDNNLGILYFYLANAQLMQKEYQNAVTSYQKSQSLLKFSNNSSDDLAKNIMNNLSVAYAQSEQYQEAENLLEAMGAENGNEPALSQNLGLVYLAQSLQENTDNTESTDLDAVPTLTNDYLNKSLAIFQKLADQEMGENLNTQVQTLKTEVIQSSLKKAQSEIKELNETIKANLNYNQEILAKIKSRQVNRKASSSLPLKSTDSVLAPATNSKESQVESPKKTETRLEKTNNLDTTNQADLAPKVDPRLNNLKTTPPLLKKDPNLKIQNTRDSNLKKELTPRIQKTAPIPPPLPIFEDQRSE
nr:tetratricopeptide repeat protein [Candidatus Gracilibacteria bacterium]